MAGEDSVYDFGILLKTLRQKKGWTQAELAERIGVHKDMVSSYENNIKFPSVYRLKKLAFAFHVSVDYLLGIERVATIKIQGLSDEDEKILQLFLSRFVFKD